MSTYERFIVANNKLIECFQALPVESWTQLSASEKHSVCQTERHEVQQILESNSVSMPNLIRERLALAQAHQ
jgi:hypothetical protein